MVPAIRLPKIKYCGLTRKVDVEAAIESGAHAIGLNFYEPSPRFVATELAVALTEVVAGRALVIGVFVNASPHKVAEIVSACPLDGVQLHGDEQPSWLEESRQYSSLELIRIIKSVPWRGLSEDGDEVARWAGVRDPRFCGFLVDAYDPVQRGGTGKTARWDLLSPKPEPFGDWPFLLAGGITEGNVEIAIETARPYGVDVASGIELAPGVKDASKMRAIAGKALPLLG